MDIYTAMCKIDCQWEAAVDHRELSSKLCDDLDREMGAGRLSREETYVYLQLVPVVIQQKLTQHRKAIIRQLKKKERLRHCHSQEEPKEDI